MPCSRTLADTGRNSASPPHKAPPANGKTATETHPLLPAPPPAPTLRRTFRHRESLLALPPRTSLPNSPSRPKTSSALTPRNVRHDKRARKPAAAPQVLRGLHARQAPLRPRAPDLHPVRRPRPRVPLPAAPRQPPEPPPVPALRDKRRDARLLHRRSPGRLLDARRLRRGPAAVPGLRGASRPNGRDARAG